MADHRPLDVAVQMDPIERINISGDSTFALLLEAQMREYEISYYTPERMALVDGEVYATVRPLTVRDDERDHFTLGEAKRSALSTFDVILMRQDPPFDLAYISATHLLERVHFLPGCFFHGFGQPGKTNAGTINEHVICIRIYRVEEA